MSNQWRFATLIGIYATVASIQAQGFALHNGDRVAWYGDSITDNSPYCIYAEAYTVLHYPHLNVRFFNAGVGGDRVTGGWMGPADQRMTRDLFSRNPTVITNMLGMNDASYGKLDEKTFDVYKTGYQHMVDRIHKEAPKARVWLFRPSPYDEVAHVTHPDWMNTHDYNGVLLQYADFVSQLAQRNDFKVVDQNAPLNEVLAKAKGIDPANAQKIIPDNIHPTWQGDVIMAEQVLKAWGAPAIVSDVQIDSASGKSTVANGKVWDVHPGPTLTWAERDESLPFPLARNDAILKLVLDSSDFDQALNQENLKVSGLAAGTYHLKIDGKDIGDFSGDQLGTGINLALYSTPMMDQAAKVLGLSNKRAELFYNKWRNLDYSLQDFPSSKLDAAKRALDGEIEELVSVQHAAAQPIDHHYELAKIK